VVEEISRRTEANFSEARNHFEAQAAKDAVVEMSGQLRVIACSLTKIANDIRWLGCGPRCGFGEILLPEVQPGSSIMPGKVNPVIAESVLMVCAQVIGNDAAVSVGGQNGNFELNVMMPVMAHNLLQSVELLTSSSINFAARCIDGIEANTERINELAELSVAICTSLAPKIGYNTAAALAKEAFKNGETIRDAARRKKVLPEDELNRLLDLKAMTKPGL
jgi:fumarate hydratase class II